MEVTFWPDFSRFGMEKLEKDMVALMTKRVFDVAGTTDKKCKVYLNGKRLAIKDFNDYVDLYFKDEVTKVQPRRKVECQRRFDTGEGYIV